MKTLEATIVILTVVLMFTSVASAQENMSDIVYLKNGSVIRGVIVENILNVSVKVQTEDGNIFVFTYDEIEKLGREQAFSYKNTQALGRKSGAAAWGLSFLLPGLGQFYNGDTTKGFVMSGLYISGIIVAETLGYDTYTSTYYDDYYDEWSYGYEYEETNTLYAVGLGVAVCTWIWSMIDAPTTASRINKEIDNGNKYGHLLEFDSGETVVGLDLDLTPKGGFGASVGVHF